MLDSQITHMKVDRAPGDNSLSAFEESSTAVGSRMVSAIADLEAEMRTYGI